MMGSFPDLYIVSPETSPASSQADEDSRRASPTTTWGTESQEDGEREARLGAIREREGEQVDQDTKK